MTLHTFVVLAYKQSQYLETCIKSVLNQAYKSKVIIASSTPNSYIYELAEKYNLDVKINNGKHGIGYDFDFAVNAADTELVTIAHQDDVYDYEYAKEIVQAYEKQRESIIIFPDYYEIKHGKEKVFKNTNLNIKQFLLFLLRYHGWSNRKFIKRSALRFGNAISCPAVTFVKANVPKEIFASDMKCNVDWLAWERLSKCKGYFCYVHKPLMGHRIYGGSTTSEIIGENLRTVEDVEVLQLFWPKRFAKLIAKLYANSEKSNEE